MSTPHTPSAHDATDGFGLQYAGAVIADERKHTETPDEGGLWGMHAEAQESAR